MMNYVSKVPLLLIAQELLKYVVIHSAQGEITKERPRPTKWKACLVSRGVGERSSHSSGFSETLGKTLSDQFKGRGFRARN